MTQKTRLMMLAAIITLCGTTFAQEDKNKPAYITIDQLPKLINIMPAPPAFDSPEFAYDAVRYCWGKRQREDSLRVAVAIADAEWDDHCKFFNRWQEAFDLEISPADTPEIWKLLETCLNTVDPMRTPIKNYYHRQRPFERYNDSMPSHEENNLRGEGSYPSGHSLRGWFTSLVLAQIAPERSEQIFARGWDYCNSRVIVGAHWQSDVDASRTAAAVSYSVLQNNEEFIAQMKKAQKEYKKKTMPSARASR